MALILGFFLVRFSQLLQYLTFDSLKRGSAIIVSLVLDEAFVRPQITYSLLDLRNKFGPRHCAMAIQFDTLHICF